MTLQRMKDLKKGQRVAFSCEGKVVAGTVQGKAKHLYHKEKDGLEIWWDNPRNRSGHSKGVWLLNAGEARALTLVG